MVIGLKAVAEVDLVVAEVNEESPKDLLIAKPIVSP